MTLEDFHVLNSAFHRPLLNREHPNFPIGVASAGAIEHWVTVKDMSPGQVILDARVERQEHPVADECWRHAEAAAVRAHASTEPDRREGVVERAVAAACGTGFGRWLGLDHSIAGEVVLGACRHVSHFPRVESRIVV